MSPADAETTLDPETQARFAELEQRLHGLLRDKYKLHWREKNRNFGVEGPAPDHETRLVELMERIRTTFDEIRLIDRKYKIPPIHMWR